jgi:hypothetical protein
MAGRLPVGQKELLRKKIIELVRRRKLNIKAVFKELKISY